MSNTKIVYRVSNAGIEAIELKPIDDFEVIIDDDMVFVDLQDALIKAVYCMSARIRELENKYEDPYGFNRS